MQNRQKRAIAIRMGCMLVLFCVMCRFIPYTDDDLRWGSAMGVSRLKNFFDGYGGRYLGYLIIMTLTRSEILKTVFMGAVLTLLCFLSPLPMFSQTVGWVSGYANYVTSVTFTMIYMAWFLRFLKQKEPKKCVVQVALLALLGLANTLIVEHFTIYNVVLAAVTAVYSYRKFGKRGKRIDLQRSTCRCDVCIFISEVWEKREKNRLSAAPGIYAGLSGRSGVDVFKQRLSAGGGWDRLVPSGRRRQSGEDDVQGDWANLRVRLLFLDVLARVALCSFSAFCIREKE